MEIDIRADVKAAEKMLANYQRSAIPKALTRTLNTSARAVKTQAGRIIKDRTKIPVGKIKRFIKIKKSAWNRLTAEIVTHRKSFNAIEFVSAARRHPIAFRKKKGVTSRTWGSNTLHEGAFIVYGQYSGKAVVIARRGKNRYKTKTIYGPALHVEFDRPVVRRELSILATTRFRKNFPKDLNFYVSRIK